MTLRTLLTAQKGKLALLVGNGKRPRLQMLG